MMPPETFSRIAADPLSARSPRRARLRRRAPGSPEVHRPRPRAGSYGIPDLWFPTNLLPLTPPKAEAICEAGVKTVGVSMDGTRPETYEAIRVGATFARLTRCFDLLKRRPAGRRDPPAPDLRLDADEPRRPSPICRASRRKSAPASSTCGSSRRPRTSPRRTNCSTTRIRGLCGPSWRPPPRTRPPGA